MKISNLKKELSKPSFLSQCCICHIYKHTVNNYRLTLKITISHPKKISILHLLSYFASTNPDIKLTNWDEQENYDFDEEIYTDLTFTTENQNIINSLNQSANSLSSLYITIHELFNLEYDPIIESDIFYMKTIKNK